MNLSGLFSWAFIQFKMHSYLYDVFDICNMNTIYELNSTFPTFTKQNSWISDKKFATTMERLCRKKNQLPQREVIDIRTTQTPSWHNTISTMPNLLLMSIAMKSIETFSALGSDMFALTNTSPPRIDAVVKLLYKCNKISLVCSNWGKQMILKHF